MSKQNTDLRAMVGKTVALVNLDGRNRKNERRLHGEGWMGKDEVTPSKEADHSLLKTRNREVWPEKVSTYYNLPLIKKAHWGWEIYIYFYLGGIAGGSYLVATLADLFGLRRAGELIRTGRYLSLICIVLSPILLVKDLGRPLRFHHMLRILKFRSAMSLGTWGLTTFGMLCGITAAYQMAQDGLLSWFPLMARLMKALPVKAIEAVGAIFGLFVASYTGVLLSSTAVPIWARAKHVLAPLFLSSAFSTGLASLSLLLSFRGKEQQEVLERLENAEIVAMTSELSLLASLPRILGPLGEPLFKGQAGTLFKVGTIGGGVILPLLARLGWKFMRRSTPRTMNIWLSSMVLIGGLILRYEWIMAGRASADDPKAIHYYNDLEWKEKSR
jgi:formate-dependent nitrite reductase membrane component NrfD